MSSTCIKYYICKDECCDFAIKIYNLITEKTGKDFELSSYKMIVADMNRNLYIDDEGFQCVEYYLNTEVQIGATPYYDDCSTADGSAPLLTDEYELGLHEIYGDETLTHYRNNKKTCLNYYDTTETKKTKRTFEINFSYDLLVIGLRFWAKPSSSSHDISNFYAVRFADSLNYNWISNINSNCESMENAFTNWQSVSSSIAQSIDSQLSSSSGYCYTDVLIYVDPLMNPGKKINLNWK